MSTPTPEDWADFWTGAEPAPWESEIKVQIPAAFDSEAMFYLTRDAVWAGDDDA